LVQSNEHDYEISLDPARIDVGAVHAFIANSYWAAGMPIATLRKAIDHSLCVSAFADDAQVGFARVVTDRATFAYLADVYVLEAHRGRGLSRRLVAALLGHPELQGLRRLMLVTRDAHGLYEKFGFTALAHPSRVMELHRPEVYAASGPATPEPMRSP
jgi:GNAT superfamily N-acetyltransferase